MEPKPTDVLKSNRELRGEIYDQILAVAVLGDILFFVSEMDVPTKVSFLRKVYRRWVGFDPLDHSNWHTSVYAGPVKEKNGRRFRPHVVHSVASGTTEVHVPPEYFINKRMDTGIQRGRIEIIHNPALEPKDRQAIVEYGRSQLGRPSDNYQGWRHDWPTYILGLRSRPQDPDKISCHGLVYNAYAQVNVNFSHQFQDSPSLLARVVGHPVGHPVDHVNLDYNYLRDHHLYRDRRFKATLAVVGADNLESVRVRQDPGKYSWNPILRERYGVLDQ